MARSIYMCVLEVCSSQKRTLSPVWKSWFALWALSEPFSSHCDWHSRLKGMRAMMWLAEKTMINQNQTFLFIFDVSQISCSYWAARIWTKITNIPLTHLHWSCTRDRACCVLYFVENMLLQKRPTSESNMHTHTQIQTDWGSHTLFPACLYSTVVTIKKLFWQQGNTIRRSKLWAGGFAWRPV